MLASLRRCPTSLRWKAVSISAASRPSNTLISSRVIYTPITRPVPSSIQLLHHSHHQRRNAAVAVAEEQTGGETNQARGKGPATTFRQLAERGLVDQGVIRTLTDKMGLETMTPVQSLTINEALKGTDVQVIPVDICKASS